jgi:hypothetical protein
MNDIGEPTVKHGFGDSQINPHLVQAEDRELDAQEDWHFRRRLTNSHRMPWKEFGKAVS